MNWLLKHFLSVAAYDVYAKGQDVVVGTYRTTDEAAFIAKMLGSSYHKTVPLYTLKI